MRVELDDRLFARPADTPGLLSIFMLGFLERHRVVLYPPGAEYQTWIETLKTLDAWSSDLCNEVLNWSLLEEGTAAFTARPWFPTPRKSCFSHGHSPM